LWWTESSPKGNTAAKAGKRCQEDYLFAFHGCGPFRYYLRILMPLSTPVIITLCILWFQYLWNDFMGPLIYLVKIEKMTVSVGLLMLRTSFGDAARRGKPTEHLLMAGSVIAMIPSLIIFFTLQRYFIKGVIMTGIKG